MPPFPKPKFAYDYAPAAQVVALRGHKTVRGIPPRSATTLLLATWNLANFGQQERREKDKQLYAEILTWFDLVAVQEVKELWRPLRHRTAHGWELSGPDVGCGGGR